MNANNLPFMRSLHNMARPHQYLRNNHPTGHASAGIAGGQPMAAASAISAGIAPAPHMRPVHGMASMTHGMASMTHGMAPMAQSMAPMAHLSKTHFATGGYVPGQPSPYGQEQGFSYSPSDVDSLNSLANTPVVAAPTPAPMNMPMPIGNNAPPDIGQYDPTLSYNTPEAQQYGSQLAQQGESDAHADAMNGFVPPADQPHKFLGATGKQWLNIGMKALGGLTGYSPNMPMRQAGIGARQAPMARSGYYAEGGQIPTGYAQGGAIPQGQPMPGNSGQDKQLILAAAAVLAGQSQDQSALQAFVQRFGQAELQHLAQVVQSGQLQMSQGQSQGQPQQSPAAAPQTNQDAASNGGLVQGPGDGTSDSVAAVHAPTGTPIQLSGGEGIVPADAMAALGNGSSEAGGRKLQAGIAALRKHKGMKRTKSNPPNLGPNQNPLFDGQ